MQQQNCQVAGPHPFRDSVIFTFAQTVLIVIIASNQGHNVVKGEEADKSIRALMNGSSAFLW